MLGIQMIHVIFLPDNQWNDSVLLKLRHQDSNNHDKPLFKHKIMN